MIARDRIVDQAILDYYAGDAWMLDLLEHARPYNANAILLPVTKDGGPDEPWFRELASRVQRKEGQEQKPEDVWIEAKRRFVGGSESAAANRESRWLTKPGLFQEKREGRRERAKPAPTPLGGILDPMTMGNVLEPVLRKAFADDNGVRVERVNGILLSRKYPFMGVNLDGVLVGGGIEKLPGAKPGDRAILECKTSGYWAGRSEDWGASWGDFVPPEYLFQGIHGCVVHGADACYYSVLIAGQERRYYMTRLDDPNVQAIIPGLIDGCRDLMEFVRRGEWPPPQTLGDVDDRYAIARAEKVEASEEVRKKWIALANARRDRKEIEELEEVLERDIKDFMGERDTLTYFSDVLVTWRNSKPRENFAQAKHRDERPECHKLYASTGKTPRPFIVKDEDL